MLPVPCGLLRSNLAALKLYACPKVYRLSLEQDMKKCAKYVRREVALAFFATLVVPQVSYN